MIEKIESVPGVQAAASSITGYPPESSWVQPVEVLGASSDTPEKAAISLIGADYFSVMKVPLQQGRTMTRAEVLRRAHVAVVNSLFAQRRQGFVWRDGSRVLS